LNSILSELGITEFSSEFNSLWQPPPLSLDLPLVSPELGQVEGRLIGDNIHNEICFGLVEGRLIGDNIHNEICFGLVEGRLIGDNIHNEHNIWQIKLE
jgi:hypothetical protein